MPENERKQIDSLVKELKALDEEQFTVLAAFKAGLITGFDIAARQKETEKRPA